MPNPEQLQAHAERIRASGVLGRSPLMLRLFNYFVDCTLVERVPKEIEVALDVFGKRPDFDVAQDAVVRVYIHKLRRKLDEYYAGAGKDDEQRLLIPKGEYRFVMQDHAEPLPPELLEPDLGELELDGATEAELEALAAGQSARHRWFPWLLAAIALLLVANLWLLLSRPAVAPAAAALNAVRANPIWAHMLDDNLPVFIVLGDYYIFGELDNNGMEPARLVREFGINSAMDLEEHLKNNPELADRYMDVALRYLPTSTAHALRNVIPLLQPGKKNPRQVQVVLASELTPTMVKSAHIIYLGLLSGMGVLKELVFDDSNFSIGDSYDELVDRKTQRHYVTQASAELRDRGSYLDYGFFSARTGVEGNELVVLAGTRDVALRQMAEILTNPAALAQLNQQVGSTDDFEALYSVQALDQTNLTGKLLLTYRFAEPNFGTTTSIASSSAH